MLIALAKKTKKTAGSSHKENHGHKGGEMIFQEYQENLQGLESLQGTIFNLQFCGAFRQKCLCYGKRREKTSC